MSPTASMDAAMARKGGRVGGVRRGVTDRAERDGEFVFMCDLRATVRRVRMGRRPPASGSLPRGPGFGAVPRRALAPLLVLRRLSWARPGADESEVTRGAWQSQSD